MIGNSLLAQARRYSLVADRLFAAIVADLTSEALAARQEATAESTLAHLPGGTITVDSNVGAFTEFTIRLPRSRQPATAATQS